MSCYDKTKVIHTSIITNQHLIECKYNLIFICLDYIMFYTQKNAVANLAINYYIIIVNRCSRVLA